MHVNAQGSCGDSLAARRSACDGATTATDPDPSPSESSGSSEARWRRAARLALRPPAGEGLASADSATADPVFGRGVTA